MADPGPDGPSEEHRSDPDATRHDPPRVPPRRDSAPAEETPADAPGPPAPQPMSPAAAQWYADSAPAPAAPPPLPPPGARIPTQDMRVTPPTGTPAPRPAPAPPLPAPTPPSKPARPAPPPPAATTSAEPAHPASVPSVEPAHPAAVPPAKPASFASASPSAPAPSPATPPAEPAHPAVAPSAEVAPPAAVPPGAGGAGPVTSVEGSLGRVGHRPAPEDLVRGRVHGDSRLRRVGQGMLRAFQPSADVQSVADYGERVQRPITTGRRIAVTSVRGGAGKSTVAALISSVFAHYRQDRVLALDVDPDLGSLSLRLGAAAEHSLDDLARDGVVAGGFEDVRPYLAQGGERLWVLPAALGEVRDNVLDPAAYEAVAVPLSRFFGITVTDCGADPTSGLNRTVLAGSHAQILVAPTTPDGAAGVGRVLDWQRKQGLGDLAARTLVVFTVKSPAAKQVLDLVRAAEILAEAGVGVERLEYDRHVAVGTTLDPRLLAYTTRITSVRLAAESLRRAMEA